MSITIPWWVNPWAEVRRLRDHLQRRSDEADKAAHYLFEVQSHSATQLRTARMEVAHARAREEAYRQKLVEIANLMPPPIQFVRKED